jgi:hypothetical protein
MASHIGRRKFLATLGGAAVAWPLAAHAQQPVMPVIGFINGGSAEGMVRPPAAFRSALSEGGYVEGHVAFTPAAFSTVPNRPSCQSCSRSSLSS